MRRTQTLQNEFGLRPQTDFIIPVCAYAMPRILHIRISNGFVRALADAKEPRLGDCWASAIRFYFEHEHLATLKPNDDWYPPSIFFQGMKFMLFGDPSLRMPNNQPPL